MHILTTVPLGVIPVQRVEISKTVCNPMGGGLGVTSFLH